MLPGLLLVEDILDRLPKERAAILAYEIRRRERELLYIGSARQVLSYHLFSAAKVTFGIGIAVFAVVWTLGQLSQIAQWMLALQQWSYDIPIPFQESLRLELGKHLPIPTSTWLGGLSQLPVMDIRQASWVAFAAMVFVVLEQGLVGFFAWQRSMKLKSAVEELEEEIAELQAWKKAK